MNFARLNHILIPSTREGRDRFRTSWFGRATLPFAKMLWSLTRRGQVLTAVTLAMTGLTFNVQDNRTFWLWSGLVGWLVGLQLIRPFLRVRQIDVRVMAPKRVVVEEVTRFSVTVSNHGDKPLESLRIGLPFLPWDGRWQGRPAGIGELGPHESKTVEVAVRFVARGLHSLDRFSVNALGPFGLVSGPPVEGEGARFTVVPKSWPLRSIKMPTRAGGSPATQAYASGYGEELFAVRPYRSGDRVRDLHARTWARTGVPHVREYRADKRLPVLLIVDSSMGAGTILEAALCLAASMLQYFDGRDQPATVVTGAAGAPVVLEHGRSSLSVALDRLACLEGEENPPHLTDSGLQLGAYEGGFVVCKEGDAHRYAGWTVGGAPVRVLTVGGPETTVALKASQVLKGEVHTL